jgi:hypothetical protein
MNVYAFEVFARDRLAELRAQGERRSRVRAARPASRLRRFAPVHALRRMGYRLRSVRPHALAGASARAVETSGSRPGPAS